MADLMRVTSFAGSNSGMGLKIEATKTEKKFIPLPIRSAHFNLKQVISNPNTLIESSTNMDLIKIQPDKRCVSIILSSTKEENYGLLPSSKRRYFEEKKAWPGLFIHRLVDPV